jgi:hypothetical protein
VFFVSYAHDFAVFCLQNNKKRRKKRLGEARKQVAEGATLKLVLEMKVNFSLLEVTNHREEDFSGSEEFTQKKR